MRFVSERRAASHALSLNLILVTNNTKYFTRVRGLKTENWLDDAG